MNCGYQPRHKLHTLLSASTQLQKNKQLDLLENNKQFKDGTADRTAITRVNFSHAVRFLWEFECNFILASSGRQGKLFVRVAGSDNTPPLRSNFAVTIK